MADEEKIKEKIEKIEEFSARFGGRPNALLPPSGRDELEDAVGRGALDKRDDTGLIAAFTLAAHQSRLTISFAASTLSISFPHINDSEKRKSITMEFDIMEMEHRDRIHEIRMQD